MISERFIATSLNEAAAVFGVQAETIRTWISRGCPGRVGTSTGGGQYDIAKMISWCRRHVWVPKQNGSSGSGNSSSDIKQRILEVELADRTLSLKRKMGHLVDRQAVKAKLTQQIVWAKNRLLAIPHEAAMHVPSSQRAETIQTWERLINRILTEMSTGEELIKQAGGDDE